MYFSKLLVAAHLAICQGLSIGSLLEGSLASPQLVEEIGQQSIWQENAHLIQLHKELVEIPSVTYTENAIGNYLVDYFESKGFTVEVFVVDEELGRLNVFVYSGDVRETKILMMTHMDTVPPFFPYRIEGDDIYGRGSVDDKASMAAQIVAFEEMTKSGEISIGDVALLIDVGEERGADGAKNAVENLQIPWETVIFGEPTDFNLIRGHKGVAGGVLRATGKTGHSSRPELGINAIDLLLDVLNELKSVDFPGSQLLGDSTLNIGTIEGGVAPNVIPGEASASFLLRVATPDVPKVQSLFDQVLLKHPRVKLEDFMILGPVLFDYDVPGFNSSVFSGGTDASVMKGDFKKYLLGPGTFNSIHAANEHISVQELVAAVQSYKDLVLYKLGN